MSRAWAGVLVVAAVVLAGCPARTGFDGPTLPLDQTDDVLDDGDPDDGPTDDAPGDGDSATTDGDAVPGDSALAPPQAFRLQYDRAWVILPISAAMTPLVPDTGSTATYSVSPTLPAGLGIDGTTGIISGTPTELVAPFSSYTITADDGVGEPVVAALLIGVINSFVVDTTADVTPGGTLGDGVCAPTGQCSIRAAVAEAGALAGLQAIIVPAGAYTLTSQLALGNDPILGSQLGGVTAIDASGQTNGALTQVAGVTSYLADLELSGSTNINPGGCVAAAGTLSLSHVYIHDCAGAVGGGISIGGQGFLQLEASHFSDNHSSFFGGAVAVQEAAGVLVTTSQFNDNSADDVGGALAIFGTVTSVVARSYIDDNTAQNGGGAIYVGPAANVTLISSTFENNNSLGTTGGALLSEGTLACRYNSFGSNLAARAGSVISVQGGTAHLRGNLMLSQATPCDDDDFGFTSDGFNVFDGALAACPDLSATTDIVNADLGSIDGSAADNGGPTFTIAIGPDTAPADVGDLECPSIDQRGEPRPQTLGSATATCDAGAYEISAQTN